MRSLGVARGGAQIEKTREMNVTAIEAIVKLATLQTHFTVLDEEIKMTSRRVNALEHVVIPHLGDTKAWITLEMDELEREEFFRVKKVVDKKKLIMEAEALEREL